MGEIHPPEGVFVRRCLQAWQRGTAISVADIPETASFEWEAVLEFTSQHSVGPQVAAAIHDTAPEQPLTAGSTAPATSQSTATLESSTESGTGPTTVPERAGVTPVSEQIPDWVIDRLRERRAFVARRNLQQFQELASLSATFQATGIRAIPYRGPVMAQVGYGDVGQREFGDLDFLVDREEIPVIKSILLEHGYEPAYVLDSTEELTVAQERWYRRFGREYTFRHTDSEIEVELHWRVLARRFPTGFTLESVWDRRDQLTIAGTSVPVLSQEDRLLLCCVHGTRHRWERLHWWCDVARCLDLEDVTLDWDAIVRRARAQNCERQFLVGLAVVDSLFGLALPDWIERMIEDDPALEGLSRHVDARLFDETPYWLLDERQYQARTLDRPRERVAFWLSWLCSPNRSDIEAIAIPWPLTPLYHLVRPIRLASGILERFRPGSRPPTELRWSDNE
ncbi:nucleotidyltransferase family protein [Natronolimnobius sp. AArcel1]|uniref:nucleotidyltransferase domain-containing protein n=1 Tax=Natronolimnobius sp. AArcel1 TaxID=1679093 RepID=UPI0013EA0E1B|nr:nucleotidyltransferase family protein [Natronolimnobius sp. AArcel1]NGM70327.1 nucleotidyltransferase family protein [Natronolimnobius sp. AArcel1]